MMNWDAASAAVAEADRVLIVTHVSPDGDAIGSMVGLGNALRQRGKTVEMAVDEGTPRYLGFIPGSDTVLPKLTTGKWDLLISVDASDAERTGQVGQYGRKNCERVINLDHHPTNTMFGDVHLVDPEAVSATEIVFHWLNHMKMPPDAKDVAMPLLTGLITDTMGFRTSNVRSETLQIAQALMKTGITIGEITAKTLDSNTYQTMQLWSQALQTLELQYFIVSVTITQENFKATKVKEVSDGGLVGLLNSIEEALIAVVFLEKEDGQVKISMRSTTGYDVGSVALSLGGGGHKQAAGATIAGPLDAARERVMKMLRDAIKEGAPTFGLPEYQ